MRVISSRLRQLYPSRRYEAINYLEVYWLFATGRLLQSSGGLEKDGNVVSLEWESALGIWEGLT